MNQRAQAGWVRRQLAASSALTAALFALLLTLSTAGHEPAAVVAGEQSNAPRELFLSGRYEESAQAYEKMRQRGPEDEVVLARCRETTGNRKVAVAGLTDAIRTHPMAALLAAELARLQSDAGEYEAAERSAQAALSLDEKNLLARWVQAELHRRSGKLDEALKGYEWLVNYFNSGPAIVRSEDRHVIGLAAAQYARWSRNHGQFKRLVSDFYPELLSREAKYWPAHLELARLFAEKYNEADAIEAINAGLAINPQAADLHVLRAQLALDKFDLATARTAVERALAVCPQHLGALRARADILLADVRPAEAIAVLGEARKLQPRDEETLGRLAASYAAVDGLPNGKPAPRMQELVHQVENWNPHAGEFYLAAGDALDRLRRFPQAAEQYRQAQAKMPQLVAARGKLGMTLMRLGKEVEAAQFLNEAFTIDPFNVRVKNTLEVLDVLQGYAALETEHFVLKFDRGRDELLATYAARYLEREVYPQLVEQFGFRPQGKTLIEIFSRARNTSGHGWFSARMAGLPAIGTVGACAGRMIALTSPEELEKKFDWARVLRHEYVHVLNLQHTDFGIPHWFTEGLAVHSEGAPRPRSWNEILSRRAKEKKLFDLDSLTFGFVRPASSDDWALAYCQAALHVDYLYEQFGSDAVAGLLAAYAERKSTSEAIAQVLQISQQEYERGYGQYVTDYLTRQGLEANREPESLAALQEAAQREHATAADQAALARAYLDRKNFPEARRYALAAQEQEARQPLAAYVLARLQLSIGDTEAALGLLEKGLKDEQPQEDLLALLAAMKLQAADLVESERLHQVGQKHFPASDRWLKGLARIYLLGQDDAKLAPVLERLAELEPDSRSIRKKLADMALAKGDFAPARQWATALIHLDVRDAEAHVQLAVAAVGMKDLAMAAEEYAAAVALDPEKPQWRLAWAEVLLALGKRDEAGRVAEELKQRDDDYPGLEALLEKLKRE